MEHSNAGITTECPLCGSGAPIAYEGLQDVTFGVDGTWNLAQCANETCGLMWLEPMPSLSEVHRFYEGYYTHRESGPGMSRMHRLFAQLVGSARDRRDAWALYLDDSPVGRLLEVGFGDGARLKYFQQKGWEVVGQEYDPVAAEKARSAGFTVHLGDLATLRLPAGSFDAVVGSHVLEHVVDPVGFLAEACRLLKPGGRIVMVTPNIKSYGHRRFGEHWRGLEVPRHLHLFSIESLERAGSGLPLASYSIRTTPVNASNFLISSVKGQGAKTPGPANRLYTKLKITRELVGASIAFRLYPACGEELIFEGDRLVAGKALANSSRHFNLLSEIRGPRKCARILGLIAGGPRASGHHLHDQPGLSGRDSGRSHGPGGDR